MKFKICKASAHGLGFLFPPYKEFDRSADAPAWIVEAWTWILQKEAGLNCEVPPWFQFPAMMRFTITTPNVLKALQSRQRDLPYSERAKPFGFVSSPLIDRLTGGHPIDADPDKFTLVSEYSSNPSSWFDQTYFNIHDGKSYRLARRENRISYEAEAITLGDIVDRYRWHREAKSLAPDGTECTHDTHGLLRRRPVIADSLRYIGKETDRRWEQGEEISMLNTFTLEYRPNETQNLTTEPDLQRKLHQFSIRALSETAGVSTRTIRAARAGKRLRRSTIKRLENALRSGIPDRKSISPDIRFTLDDSD